MGNIRSIVNAIEHFGVQAIICEDPEQIRKAKRLILPGVGAFKDGMKALHAKGFVDPIKASVFSGRPFLGICLGMQMMLEESEEFGINRGLCIISGQVRAIPKMILPE